LHQPRSIFTILARQRRQERIRFEFLPNHVLEDRATDSYTYSFWTPESRISIA
jgi:hypothetical protein